MFPGLLLGLALAAPPADDAHKDAVAQFGAAVWNLRRERLLSAARQLEDAAQRDPDATAPQRELVRLYSLLGRDPDAIRVAREVLKKDPADFDTAHTLARLLFDAGELTEAVAAAKKAAECDIPLARADKALADYRNLAILCENAYDPAAAEQAIRAAVVLVTIRRADVIEAGAFTPREADAAAAEWLERLGRILTRLEKYDDAVSAFTRAAKLHADPQKGNDPSAAARLDWNLSGVLQAQGDSRKALTHLESVLSHKPLSPEPYLRLGQLYRSLGRERDVVDKLRGLLDKDEANLSLKTVLAVELARSGIEGDDREADRLIAKVMAATNERPVVELIIRSRLAEHHADRLAADLDRVFAKIKDNDGNKPADTPEAAETRTFAAEKARTIASVLKEMPNGTEQLLKAAADDLAAGVKHQHQTHYFLAQLALRHNRLDLAEYQLGLAKGSSPPESRGDVYLALIQVKQLNHKPAEVAAVCREALLDSKQTYAPFVFHYHRALALAELGRADEAIAAAEKAIQDTGHNDRLTVKLHKVDVLNLLRRWDDALAYAALLYDEYPALADRQRIRYVRAIVYSTAGRHDKSEAELRAILDVDPDHAGACNNLGYQLADVGRDLPEAERLVRHAIEVDRFDNRRAGETELYNGMYLDSLGWVLFRQGKTAAARTELERAVALNSGVNQPVIWDHLGDVRFRLGDKAQAKTAWEKAKDLYEKQSPPPLHRYNDQLEEVKRKLERVP